MSQFLLLLEPHKTLYQSHTFLELWFAFCDFLGDVVLGYFGWFWLIQPVPSIGFNYNVEGAFEDPDQSHHMLQISFEH